MTARPIIPALERHVDMTGFHQAFFIFLSVLAFGALQLSFWLRDRKATTSETRFQREWWKIKNWRKRDWLGVGFFTGYACVILVYWLSSVLADFMYRVLDG